MLEEIKQKITALKTKVAELKNILNLGAKQKQLADLDREAADPKLWENQEKAKKILQEKSLLEKDIAHFKEVNNELEELITFIELAKEEDAKDLELQVHETQKKVSGLELAALLSQPYDKSNAILSINAGAGGTDAQDWAQILLRMYTRWAESKSYKVEMPEISYGEEAGIKGVTLIVSGPYAYGYLKGEAGIHRLVRISPFSSEGKRHTSFVAVEVIPEIAEDIKVEINPNDLRVDTYRASGPGGQNVNKTDSAVRITHIPTGIIGQSQSERSQLNNRAAAMKLLKARLYEMMLTQHKEKIDELRGEKKKIEWGSQIRSYVFQPYTLVKDHRSGFEVGNVQAVIDGELDGFMASFLKGKGK